MAGWGVGGDGRLGVQNGVKAAMEETGWGTDKIYGANERGKER